MMIIYKYCEPIPAINLFNLLISLIAIWTFIIFILDIVINKNNIFKLFKEKKSAIILALSFISLAISAISADNIKFSIIGNGFRFGGLLSYVFYIFLAILGYKLTDKNRAIFFRCLIYTASFISILSLTNFEFTKEIFLVENAGIFANINHFSTYLNYIIIINIFTFYNDKNKYIGILDFICFIILVGMLIINGSFACYLGIMLILIITIVYAIKNKKILKYLAMFSIFFTISFTGAWMLVKGNFEELFEDLGILKTYYEDYSDNNNKDKQEYYFELCLQFVGSNRGELWRYGFEMAKEKPILGYGLENFSDDYLKYPLESQEDLPHNLILFLWLSGGIITLLLYLIANFMILGKNWRNFYLNNSITPIWFLIISHLFQSMFNNTLFYTTSLYAILFGMIYKNIKEKKDS